MDPLLKSIIESRRYDLLNQEHRPEWAIPLSQGRPEYQDPMVAKGRFAAPDTQAASANVAATVGEENYDDKTFADKVARFVGRMLMGSPNHMILYDQKTGRKELNPAHARDIAMGFGPGILAGPKGAVNLGGQKLQRYRIGEAAAKTSLPSQELWRSYGYAKGAEGKGRFEISDVPAKLKEGASKAKTVGEALEHPELFAAYPELARIPLSLRINTLLSQGSYNPTARMIHAQGLGEQEVKSVLLHELEHTVQDIEGFAAGANMKGGREAYERSAGEIEAYNVQARLANPDLMKMAPELTESLPREMQHVNAPGVVDLHELLGQVSPQVAKQILTKFPGRKVVSEAEYKAAIGDPTVSEWLGPSWDEMAARNPRAVSDLMRRAAEHGAMQRIRERGNR